MHYPLFIDITHMRCLIVGAGQVGQRKAQGLLAAGPQEVLLLDVAPLDKSWQPFLAHTCLSFEQRTFVPEDVQGRSLVFACTGLREVNAQVAATCAAEGILCNCTDAPEEGNCIVPAVARAHVGSLVAALSTGGASPAWARIMKTDLEAWLEPKAAMTQLLGRLRPLVLAMGRDTGHNTALFRRVAQSTLPQALAVHDATKARLVLEEVLPDELCPYIAELLHDIF